MKNFRLLVIALALLTSFSACKKDDAPKVKTTAEKISSAEGKKWKITSMKAKFSFGGQQREMEVFSDLMSACRRDNLTVLFSNKKYEAREGATKCDNNNDLLNTGTWELKNKDTELHVSVNQDVTYSTLKEVSETSLITEFPMDLVYTVNNQAYDVEAIMTATYTAQ
jgi:hypothetical protein